MIKIKNILKISCALARNFNQLSITKDTFKDISQSKYFRPLVPIEDFFNKLAIDFRSGPSTFRVKQCLFCTKPHYNELTNLFTLNVSKNNGAFFCFRCSTKGSWHQLKAKYLGNEPNEVGEMLSGQTGQNAVNENNLAISQTEYFFYTTNLKKPQYVQVLTYLKDSGLTQQTIDKFQVGAGTETFISPEGKPIPINCIYFPMFQPISKSKKTEKVEGQTAESQQKIQVSLTKVKIRGATKQKEKHTRSYPSGAKHGFFGYNNIAQNDKIIVITQGQLDAMAVYQQTGYPAISLPQGPNSLHDQLTPFLNQFEKIVLWMDNDEAGMLGQDKISYKLGSSRTYIVRNPNQEIKNASEYLLKAPGQMKELIDKSKTKPSQNVIKFDDIRESIRNRIFKHEQYIGIKVDWLPFFNKKVKGIRMQEVSIISGPTGCGKTTLLTQISLDLCKKQIPVLWGSFQIKNQVLVTNMLMQYSGMNLYKNKELFDHYSQQFMKLPLYYLSFHGSNDVEKVLATIQYSIQKHNISFVVLDTLQFLLSDQAQGFKKFDLQDKVISRLRKIATNHNVHIAIVIHPRKVEDNQDIQIHSIYGTSKAAQQSDNIWMLQSRDNYRIFDIKKNRFDGDIGKAALGYNRFTKSFIQLTKNQLSALFNSQQTMQEIIEKREQKQKNKDKSVQQQHQTEQTQTSDILPQKRKRRRSEKKSEKVTTQEATTQKTSQKNPQV